MIEYESENWLKIAFTVQGTVLPRILGRIILLSMWTAGICWLHQEQYITFNIGTSIHSIMGLALGLLLVFRTNTAYDRFWEGRRQWADLMTLSRTLSLRLDTVIPKQETKLRAEFAELLTAFARCLKERAREGIEAKHLPNIREDFRDEIMSWGNKPNAVSALIGERLRFIVNSGWMDSTDHLSFDTDMNGIAACMGSIDRIRQTPIPFAYVNQLKVFMMLYFISIPLALCPVLSWGSILGAAAIAYALLGIEEIGVEIEDPFGEDPNDLPADELCDVIEQEMREILIPGLFIGEEAALSNGSASTEADFETNAPA